MGGAYRGPIQGPLFCFSPAIVHPQHVLVGYATSKRVGGGGGDKDTGGDVCGDGWDGCNILGCGGKIAFDGRAEKDRRICREWKRCSGRRSSDDGEGG